MECLPIVPISLIEAQNNFSGDGFGFCDFQTQYNIADTLCRFVSLERTKSK